MKRNHTRWLVVVGLVLMVIGIVDPLEGSVVVLGGSILVALGAFRSQNRSRVPFTAVVLIAFGVGVMLGMSALGGVGGNTDRSVWWVLFCLPYPIGWILGLIGAASEIRAPRHARPASC